MQKVAGNVIRTTTLRKILFAVHHLPEDMPNYWKTIKEFAKVGMKISELQTTIENMEFFSGAAFSTDEELLQEICRDSVGVVLILPAKKCGICDVKLTTRADRPR